MDVINLLAPIFLIIALGAALQRGGMLPAELVTGLNRLLYWVGLPAAVFGALVGATEGGEGFGPLLAVMAGATMINAVWSWLESPLLGIPVPHRGTFVQASFRGNLSFIGLPLLLSVPGVPIGRAMLALAPMLILHNAVTVFVLLASQHQKGAKMWVSIGREVVRNPIIVASVAGVIAHTLGWVPPVAIMGTIQPLGRMALPLALLCIGAALTSSPVRGNRRLASIASVHKVVVSPLLGYGLGRAVGLDHDAMLALLICLACPTAAVSYTMVKQMGGDEGLAATSVVYASVASAVSLALVIALFAGS